MNSEMKMFVEEQYWISGAFAVQYQYSIGFVSQIWLKWQKDKLLY